MGSDRLFLVYCEVAGAPLRERGLAGAFVTCFVPNWDIVEAITAAKMSLVADGYDVLDIDKTLEFVPDDWLAEPEYGQLAAQALATSETKFSSFDAWGH